MEKVTLTIEQWVRLRNNNENDNVPVWFQVTGNSMFPFIRAFQDDVMIVSVPNAEYKIGDIVLFPAKRKGGDYCLHRLYKMDGERVQTLGDGCKNPDGWFTKDKLLGKAVLIKRGNKTIDCESPKWVKIFRFWNRFWRIRPVMLFPFRVVSKCKRIIGKGEKKR
ncbi:MAG: S24/S26 family peptidase [Lachnospiraceae bacterium]|nr:S24/S26 family peptidase [Lachnospiraceae bacterium]